MICSLIENCDPKKKTLGIRDPSCNHFYGAMTQQIVSGFRSGRVLMISTSADKERATAMKRAGTDDREKEVAPTVGIE